MDVVAVVPLKRKATAVIATDDTVQPNQDAIRCICGFDYDDGFSIACDHCSRWCHAACFRIVDGDVPEEWKCWLCEPRPVDRDYAERLQRARFLRQRDELRELDKHRRRLSPGLERKHRRPSAIADHPKRRRRPSIMVHEDDTHIDIDEPSTHAYVPISQDIVHPDARAKLRRHAHHWRGVTALSSPSPRLADDHTIPVCLAPDEVPTPTILKQLPSAALSHPSLSLFTNSAVRPPAYSLHTAAPVPSDRFITPYTSSITTTSSYLADPLNAYAHLGMPKPFVHLIGPPLDVALDARLTGDNARFLRSGCRPNAVLRPVICSRDTDNALSFGVFALRELKANEEVVLGWEWDDGNAIHSLPALIQAPHSFPHLPSSSSPHQIQHLRNQMSNILHALSSTFTVCACGSKAKDCAVNAMATFVDGGDLSSTLSPHQIDLGPLIGKSRGFRTREKIPFSSGMAGVEMCPDTESHMDLDPLPHFVVNPSSPTPKQGKGKAKANGPTNDDVVARSALLGGHSRPRTQLPLASSAPTIHTTHLPSTSSCTSPLENERPLPEPDPPDDDPPLTEDRMPPKMRKRWKQHVREQRKLSGTSLRSPSPSASIVSLGSTDPGLEVGVGLGIRVGDSTTASGQAPVDADDLAPPSLSCSPHGLDPLGNISPSADFARLSLISPRTDLSLPSPFQPWAPFERKESHKADPSLEDAMEVDTTSNHPHSHPSSRSEAHSPPVSVSSRSPRSPRSPRAHPSPTSTAVTTPPSPREPKLPDVPPQPSIADSPESPPVASGDPPSPTIPSSPHDDDTMMVDRQQTPLPPPEAEARTVEAEGEEAEASGTARAGITEDAIAEAEVQAENAEMQAVPEADRSLDLEREPTPMPVPLPPKVKMSLKDFAARKKRQREEFGMSDEASPVVGTASLQSSPKLSASAPLPAPLQALAPATENDQEKRMIGTPALKVDAKPLPRFAPPPSYSLPVKLRSEMGHTERKDVDADPKDEEQERLAKEEQEKLAKEEQEKLELARTLWENEMEREKKVKERIEKEERERKVNEWQEKQEKLKLLREGRERKQREVTQRKIQGAMSLQAKKELVEQPLFSFNGSTPLLEHKSQPLLALTPPPSDSAHSRVSSQEDGEIPSLPPAQIPRAPRAMVRETPTLTRRPVINPPTGPRMLLLAQERFSQPPSGPSFLLSTASNSSTQQSTIPAWRTPHLPPPPPPQPITSPPPPPPAPPSSSSTSLPASTLGRPTPQAPRALSQRTPGDGIRSAPHAPPSSSSSSSSSPAPSAQASRTSNGTTGSTGPVGLPVRPPAALGMGNTVMGIDMNIPRRPSIIRNRYSNPPARDADSGRDRERERDKEREREYRDRVWPQRPPPRTRETAPWGR